MGTRKKKVVKTAAGAGSSGLAKFRRRAFTPKAPGRIRQKPQAGGRAGATRQLRELSQRLTYHVDNCPLAVIEWGPDLRLIRWSGAAERVFGWKAEEVLGKRREDFRWVYREDEAQVARVSRDLETGASLRAFSANRNYRKDGSVVYCEWYNSSLLDASGKLQSILSLVLDVSERKRVEDALREAERKYRELVRLAPAGLYEIDFRTQRFTSVNEAICELTGYSREELLTMNPLQILDAEGQARFQNRVARCLKGETPESNVEYRVRTKDGRSLDVILYATFTTDQAGRPVGATVVGHDVTERKRAEIALRDSEERYRTLFDTTSDGVWLNDLDGKILEVNDAYCRMSGYSRDELRGMPISALEAAGSGQETTARIRRVLQAGGHDGFESRHRRKDGSVFDVDITALYLRREGGRIAIFSRDITRRKEFQAELERVVAERTAKLQELVDELEHFSYSIVHDMRAPLRSMRGFAELASEYCANLPEAEPKELLQRLITSADRMDLLIRDALNYSQAVRRELPLEVVDPAELLRGMLDSYPELQPSKAQIRIENELPLVMGNEAGLTQCFSNVLNNAVKFIEPGKTPQIRIWSEQREGWVRIWFGDNGIGIPRPMLPRLFDMFSRGHNKYEGTGIGLALVRKVVQRMGGKVGVESEEGKGSQFWLDLKPGESRTAHD
jgi:PAS domain S-box-containing protein